MAVCDACNGEPQPGRRDPSEPGNPFYCLACWAEEDAITARTSGAGGVVGGWEQGGGTLAAAEAAAEDGEYSAPPRVQNAYAESEVAEAPGGLRREFLLAEARRQQGRRRQCPKHAYEVGDRVLIRGTAPRHLTTPVLTKGGDLLPPPFWSAIHCGTRLLVPVAPQQR